MSSTILLVLLIITIAIAISQFGVILYFLNFIKKNELHDGAVKDAQTKSAAVILDAVGKANEVVAQAERNELEKITQGGKALDSLSQTTQQQLQLTAQHAQQALEESAKMAESSYEQLAQKSEAVLEGLITQDRQLLEQKTNQAIEQSSTMFQKFMGNVAEQVRGEIDEEIKKANAAIDTYKAQRLAAIDAKVIDILEEILLETLGKKLSLKDEGEFVYQALEQAKKEHAFS